MFWRTKAPTQQQSTGAVSSDGSGSLQENPVCQPANHDVSHVRPVELTQLSASIEGATSERPYVIPKSYRVSGNLFMSRPVLVRGEVVDGSVDATTLIVSEGGRLGVPTKAIRVAIEGVAEADVSAAAELRVGPKAIVRGSLNAPVVRVEPGAKVSEATLFVGPKR